MTIVVQNANPSTLIDVIAQCVQALDAMGIFLPTLVGRAYLKQSLGTAPRVIFVPEPSGGKITSGNELGMAARVHHSCEVYVRGRESGSDIGRFKETYDLADLVIGLVATAAPGRLDWGSFLDGSPADTDAYGSEIAFSFTYRRDVPHNAARWSLPSSLADLFKKSPQPPPGTQGDGVVIVPTTIPKADNEP